MDDIWVQKADLVVSIILHFLVLLIKIIVFSDRAMSSSAHGRSHKMALGCKIASIISNPKTDFIGLSSLQIDLWNVTNPDSMLRKFQT